MRSRPSTSIYAHWTDEDVAEALRRRRLSISRGHRLAGEAELDAERANLLELEEELERRKGATSTGGSSR